MWVKVDDVIDMTEFLELHNNSACYITAPDGMKNRFQMLGLLDNLPDCEAYYYIDPKFKLIVGFRTNDKSAYWMFYNIIQCEEIDYPKAHLLLAKKTKEYIDKVGKSIRHIVTKEETVLYNSGISKVGWDNWKTGITDAYESIGLNIDYGTEEILIWS